MAEQRRTKQQPGAARKRGNSRNGLSGREVIERVRSELPRLVGQSIESVVGLERDDDSGWHVTVQVVELARIPHSTDVLGAYEVNVDSDGELVGWRRRRRYYRNQAEDD
jgi:gas vesicle protein GvpO